MCTVRSVYIGLREQIEEMCAAIESNDIKPVVDRQEFTLDKVRESYYYMWAKKNFGKWGTRID